MELKKTDDSVDMQLSNLSVKDVFGDDFPILDL